MSSMKVGLEKFCECPVPVQVVGVSIYPDPWLDAGQLRGPWRLTRLFFSRILTDALPPYRNAIREPMAEFFGTALLVIFGAGAGASVVLSGSQGVASSSKGVGVFPRAT